MVKRTRKNKRGGLFGLFENTQTTSTYTPTYTTSYGNDGFFSGITNFFTGATKKVKETGTNIVGATEGALASVQENLGFSQSTPTSTYIPPTETYTTNYNTPSISNNYGGKRRNRRIRTHKRLQHRYQIRGGSDLAFYASPIKSGTLRVAQPTYWINTKGGRRKTQHRKRKFSKKN